MAGRNVITFAVLAALVAVTTAANFGEFHLWEPCNYTEVQGETCKDCRTRLICTKIGGLVLPCVWPGHPHCNEGRCSSEPSEECAQEPEPEPPTDESNTPDAE